MINFNSNGLNNSTLHSILFLISFIHSIQRRSISPVKNLTAFRDTSGGEIKLSANLPSIYQISKQNKLYNPIMELLIQKQFHAIANKMFKCPQLERVLYIHLTSGISKYSA